MKIDNEFHSIIPTLTEEEKTQLRQSIKEDGIRDELVVWGDILIDGHNRYEIAQEFGIKYKTINKDFASRSLAKEWIIKNQFGRRNLSLYQRGVLALKLKGEISARAKERQKEHGKTAPGRKTLVQNSAQVNRKDKTRDELARIAGVSHDTIHKVGKIEALADDKTKEMLKKGDITVRAAYLKIRGKKSNKEEPVRKRHSITEIKLSALIERVEGMAKQMNVQANSALPGSWLRGEIKEVLKVLYGLRLPKKAERKDQ